MYVHDAITNPCCFSLKAFCLLVAVGAMADLPLFYCLLPYNAFTKARVQLSPFVCTYFCASASS